MAQKNNLFLLTKCWYWLTFFIFLFWNLLLTSIGRETTLQQHYRLFHRPTPKPANSIYSEHTVIDLKSPFIIQDNLDAWFERILVDHYEHHFTNDNFNEKFRELNIHQFPEASPAEIASIEYQLILLNLYYNLKMIVPMRKTTSIEWDNISQEQEENSDTELSQISINEYSETIRQQLDDALSSHETSSDTSDLSQNSNRDSNHLYEITNYDEQNYRTYIVKLLADLQKEDTQLLCNGLYDSKHVISLYNQLKQHDDELCQAIELSKILDISQPQQSKIADIALY